MCHVQFAECVKWTRSVYCLEESIVCSNQRNKNCNCFFFPCLNLSIIPGKLTLSEIFAIHLEPIDKIHLCVFGFKIVYAVPYEFASNFEQFRWDRSFITDINE